MSWAAVFWIIYGVGSTLFMIYLFRMGRNVAHNRKDLIRGEFESMAGEHATADTGLASSLVKADTTASAPDPISRLHVERIFQPDDHHVAVQGVRDGETCVINLPLDDAGDDQWVIDGLPLGESRRRDSAPALLARAETDLKVEKVL